MGRTFCNSHGKGECLTVFVIGIEYLKPWFPAFESVHPRMPGAHHWGKHHSSAQLGGRGCQLPCSKRGFIEMLPSACKVTRNYDISPTLQDWRRRAAGCVGNLEFGKFRG